jgi:competence protein ComEA
MKELWVTINARLQTLKEAVRFTREQLIALAVLGVIAALGGLLTAQQSALVPVVKADARNTGKTAGGRRLPATQAVESATETLLVHVAGDVINPGLKKLPVGSRVADAVEAAGGPVEIASLDNLNLAARLIDGQKILVKTGAQPSMDDSASDGSGDILVNINLADQTSLERLDGVGPILAKRIADWREKHGGFSAVSQLQQVDGIGPKKYARLKEQVSLN